MAKAASNTVHCLVPVYDTLIDGEPRPLEPDWNSVMVFYFITGEGSGKFESYWKFDDLARQNNWPVSWAFLYRGDTIVMPDRLEALERSWEETRKLLDREPQVIEREVKVPVKDWWFTIRFGFGLAFAVFAMTWLNIVVNAIGG